MHMRFFLKLLLLPVLGIIGGYAIAYIYLHGMHVTWRNVGNPGEKIAYILGLTSPNELLVATETGKLATLEL